jgi:hypothetical protein
VSAGQLPDRIVVGVIVERHKATSAWLDFVWRPVGVLCGLPETEPWSVLSIDGEATLLYAGAAEIELHRSEADNYRNNLASGQPSLWIVLYPADGEPPYRLAAVTADPSEGEGLTEAVDAIVEMVAMPEPIREALARFVAKHHVEHKFEKRVQDRADPEALARRGPGRRHRDE